MDEMQEISLEELYEALRQMATNLPAWIERVDADASHKPELWGKRAIHIVLPHGREIWIQKASK